MLFDRTFHPDEANQAFTTGRLLETGQYAYRPDDHHGPTLYYAAAAIQKVSGHDTLATMDGTLLRCTPLVFAVLALVLGFFALKRLTKSFVPGLAFALLLGTSSFFAFFATDFIQEVLLASFLVMMFWAGTGYLHPGTKWKTGTWSLFFGTAAGLAFATKETCLISFASIAIAAAPFIVKRMSMDAVRARARDGVLAVLGFFIVTSILYSDLGRDFHGVYNAFIAAPLSYLGRAAGDASASTGANWHVHPWWQYFRWLYDGNSALLAFFLVAASFGAFAAWRRASETTSRAFRFTLCYALATLAIYSLIPYKTPWCAVQIELPLVLASVLGLACVAEALPRSKWISLSVLAVLLLVKGNIPALVRMNRDPDSTANPCNYAAASPEVKELAATVASALATATNHEPPFIAVALPAADTWPFPWYNRPNENITGYWESFDDLKRLAETGIKPTVVIVPMEEGHLVQPLFPHLKHTKRFYMRPRIPERKVQGMRVRVFW